MIAMSRQGTVRIFYSVISQCWSQICRLLAFYLYFGIYGISRAFSQFVSQYNTTRTHVDKAQCNLGIIIKILAGRIYAEGLAKLIGGRVGIYSFCTQACKQDSIRPCLVYLANWNHTFASVDPCTNILASCFGRIAPIHAKFDLWVVTIRSSLLGIPYTVLSKQVSRSQNCCSSPLQSYPMVYYILWISNFVRFLHKTQHPWQFNLSSHYTH